MMQLKRKTFVAIVVLAVLAGAGAGVVASSRGTLVRERTVAAPFVDAPILPVQMPLTTGSFAKVADVIKPAVVNINTVFKIGGGVGPGRTPFEEFFGDEFFKRFFGDSPERIPQRSLGSGVIVDPSGIALTNAHVVEKATDIEVVTLDGSKHRAKIIGLDKKTDLAVLKLDDGKATFRYARLGDSEKMQVGDWVIAVGSPFGLQSTVTAGIISAKDRGNVGRQFQRFLQTDAAINPGNSGGPLVDMAGQVIGINTAIITGSRGYEGVGFAMPSNTAINVYNQLISRGRVTRGSIGVSFTEERGTNPVTLKELGADYGIAIEAVEPGSPAEKAGLQAGDVITKVNGNAVHTGNDMVNPIAQTPIGSKVHIDYVRDRKEHEASLTVEDRTKVFPGRVGSNEGQPGESAPGEFGLRVEELTPERARRAGMEGQRGVMVTEVEPAGFADDVGLARGDVIVEVNHEVINTAGDFRRSISKLKTGQNVVFKVMRRQDSERVLTVFLAGVVPADQQ